MTETQVEVDDKFETESVASSTTSLTDSIGNYGRENERTYHAYDDGTLHCYPNDQRENDRLDLQHHLWSLTLHGKLGVSPPNQAENFPGRVLDVGTGTGIWAIDFADQHPSSIVIGVDLSPTQPTRVPPNLVFQIDDVEDEWTFSAPFDYVHSRAMNGSIADWPVFVKRCFNALQPGGWLELQEFGLGTADDDTMGPDTALAQACQILIDGGEKLGRAFIDVSGLASIARAAGFVGVVEEQSLWPGNAWPKDPRLKELGVWNKANMKAGIEGFILALGTRGLDLVPEDVTGLAAQCQDELNDKRIHSYWPINVVYAQKPML